MVWCGLLYLNGCPSKVCELVSKVRQFTSPVMKPFLEKDFSFMPVETGCVKKIKTQATFFFFNYLLEIAIAGFITICILQI